MNPNSVFSLLADSSSSEGEGSPTRHQSFGFESVYEDWIDPSHRDIGEIICTIHHGVPLNPVSHSQCPAKFCKTCIGQWIQHGNNSCPNCRGTVYRADEYKTNADAKAVCDSVPIKCPAPGCGWTGVLAEGEAHFMACAEDACPNEGCGWIGKKNQLAAHSAACEHRLIRCACGKRFPFHAQEAHKAECSYTHIECPKCSFTLRRRDLCNHEHYDCPESEVECPHRYWYGCAWKGKRRERMEHSVACDCRPIECECFKQVAIKDMEAHVRDTCPHTLVPCTLCSQQVSRGNLGTHESYECPESITECRFRKHGCEWTGVRKATNDHHAVCEYRAQECAQCYSKVPLKLMEEHVREVCPGTVIPCPHCSKQMPRHELSEHKRLSCPTAPVPCKLSVIGCAVEMHRDLIRQHESKCSFSRLEQRLRRLEESKPSPSPYKIERDFHRQLDRLERNMVEHVEKKMVDHMEKLEFTLGKRNAELEAQVRDLREQVKRLKSDPSAIGGGDTGSSSSAQSPYAPEPYPF